MAEQTQPLNPPAQQPNQLKQPPHQEFKLWNAPVQSTSSAASGLADLPEAYFQPTAAEITSAYAGQTRAREALSNAPLKTQAIREREERARIAKWPNTTIRVKFPNQMMLESTFPSTSGIKAVYAFIRNVLTEEAKPNKFVLSQPLPRQEYRVSDPAVKTLTLAELQLAPSSVLLLHFLDDSLNDTSQVPPLLPSILAMAADLPPPPTFTPPVVPETSEVKDEKGKGKEGPVDKDKMQKFFKLGGAKK